MKRGRQPVLDAIDHLDAGRAPLAFGVTMISGRQCRVVTAMRGHLGWGSGW